MLLIDAHVHIYECYDLSIFFDSAYANFKSEAENRGYADNFIGILLLSETSNDNWFHRLSSCADGESLVGNKNAGKWKFHRTDEHCSLYARTDDNRSLVIVAGRQINTSEGLEVLALISNDVYSDDLSIAKVFKMVSERGSIFVLPWGVGKWFGNRGEIISNLIGMENTYPLYIGDNSGRPTFWKKPKQFHIAEDHSIAILPGSDPLPFISEQIKAGSYGFWVKQEIDRKQPAYELKKILINEKSVIRPYGFPENTFRFLKNQIRMQVKKRFQ